MVIDINTIVCHRQIGMIFLEMATTYIRLCSSPGTKCVEEQAYKACISETCIEMRKK